MRLIADENVSRHVIERLRSDGLDISSISELNRGIADLMVLDAAKFEERVLITADQDFGELAVRHGLGLTGLILLRLERLSSGAVADRIAEMIQKHSHRVSGNLIVIEPGRVRIRTLRHWA